VHGRPRDRRAAEVAPPPAEEANANQIRCCTINKFKGLEARAVVLTDVGNVDKSGMRELLVD
jgi:hypothetical protein